MRCDLHCPEPGGGVILAVATGAGLLLAYLAAEVVESMLLAVLFVAGAIFAGATCIAIRVLHSHRGTSYATYEPGRVITVPSVTVRAAAYELSPPRRAIPPARPALHAIAEPARMITPSN